MARTGQTMPTYRERLRVEGAVLALCGLLGSAGLLLLADGARENVASTVGQLFVVLALLLLAGPRLVEAWARDAQLADPSDPAWTGDPTPLWTLPVITAVLAALFGLAALDAALRITGGCALVGLAQLTVLQEAAGKAERRLGGTLVRAPGSRIWRTRLGVLR
jgi:hypothetical protein